MTQPDGAFLASIARRRLAAGALITDGADRVLIVEPSYKDHWEVPGGLVEEGETPAQACARELREELGLDVRVGRLLVVEHQNDAGPRGDSAMFVYDGGVVLDPRSVTLAADELNAFGFYAREELGTRLSPKLARRMGHALDALHEGTVIELENGVRRGSG